MKNDVPTYLYFLAFFNDNDALGDVYEMKTDLELLLLM